MDDFRFKHSITTVKFSGFDPSLDLEDDIYRPSYEETYSRHLRDEEMKRKLLNKHLDPTYMECRLPEPPNLGNGLSFDPNEMSFNFKKGE